MFRGTCINVQGCGISVPDLPDLVRGAAGQVLFFTVLVRGQVD